MQRIFSLKDGVLEQDTYLEDEFGELCLCTYAHLQNGWIRQHVATFDDGERPCPVSLETMISEMSHFLSILKLFDPRFNTRNYGLPQIVSQTPPEPWETE